MPPVDPTQYIRTLKLHMVWTVATSAMPDEIGRVCEVLNASHVQIERQIEDCVDEGLRGKGFDDTNTRVRLPPLMDALVFEPTIQVTLPALLPETQESKMLIASKAAECAAAVLQGRLERQGLRVTELQRIVTRLPNEQREVVSLPAPPTPPAKSPDPASLQRDMQSLAGRVAANNVLVLLALLALIVVIVLLVLLLLRG